MRRTTTSPRNAQYSSFLDGRIPKVIVPRTFSKMYAIAGLRLGYAVGTAEDVKEFRSSQTHDNVNIAGRRAEGWRWTMIGDARCRRPQCGRPGRVLESGAVTRAEGDPNLC